MLSATAGNLSMFNVVMFYSYYCMLNSFPWNWMPRLKTGYGPALNYNGLEVFNS